MKKKVYYVIGGPYVSDQAGLNRGPLIQNRFHCYFVYTFCKDRINIFLILILFCNVLDCTDGLTSQCQGHTVRVKVNISSAFEVST